MAQKNIPLVVAKKYLKQQGALRVSDEASEKMIKILEKRVEEIANLARQYAKHANRNTVLESDVDLAIRNLPK